VLRDVVLDELQQHVGHTFALCGRGGFEGIVQFNFNIQIHSFDLRFFSFADYAHLPSRR
jgi:hypothetical protein